MSEVRAVDLFCGAGGVSTGLADFLFWVNTDQSHQLTRKRLEGDSQ